MKSEKKTCKTERLKFEALESRRSEMWVRKETARGELRDGYDVTSVLYNPWQMADLSNRLHQEGSPMREYPQSSPNLTAMSHNLVELIQHGNIQLYPDDQLRSHAAHCVAVESARGWKISKKKPPIKLTA